MRYLLLVLLCVIQTIYTQDDYIPELKYVDTNLDPCEDFYQYACGHFNDYHSRDENILIVDHFNLLEDKLMRLANDLLQRPPDSNDPIALKKAKAAYHACVDTDYADQLDYPEMRIVEEAGGFPLLVSTNQAGRGNKKFGWNEIGELVAQYGVPLLFDYELIAQFYQPNDYYIYLKKDSLSVPSLLRKNYRKSYDELLEESFRNLGERLLLRRTPQLALSNEPFDIFLRTISKRLLNLVNPGKTEIELEKDLDDMANFMRNLHAGGIVEDDVVLEALDSFPTLGQLQNWTNQQFDGKIDIDWIEYLGKVFSLAGVNVTSDVSVMQVIPRVIYGTLNLVHQTDPDVIKNFALLRIFLFLAPDSDAIVRQAFEDYFSAKNYTLYQRWEYCTRKLVDISGSAGLNFALIYDYGRYHYDINALRQVANLVTEVRASFAEIIKSADWIDDESRSAALRKLDNIIVSLAYPDFVDDAIYLDAFYSNVRICQWDNYGNSQKIRAFRLAHLYSRIDPNTSRDRTFWDKSSFEVNAYYNRPNNKIVLPLAILHPPFYVGNPLVDVARIGAIIGHELTHGFDLNGKNYDENGLMNAWWSTETLTKFEKLTQCFISQYDKYFIEAIGQYVNGTSTLNENLADNGGIREAYRSYNQWRNKMAIGNETINGYTTDQLFFISYATMWCVNESPAYLQKLSSEIYPPTHFRVNGALSNMAEFGAAFKCPSGAPMNPLARCVLW